MMHLLKQLTVSHTAFIVAIAFLTPPCWNRYGVQWPRALSAIGGRPWLAQLFLFDGWPGKVP